jgi:hypothetical protein
VVDSLAVRIWRPGVRAYACWTDKDADGAGILAYGVGACMVGVMELRTLIVADDVVEAVCEARERAAARRLAEETKVRAPTKRKARVVS